jgi:signal transduction histidine kinase
MTQTTLNGASSDKQTLLPQDVDAVLLKRISMLGTAIALLMGLWQLMLGRVLTGGVLVLMSIALGMAVIHTRQAGFGHHKLNLLVGTVALFMLTIGLLAGVEVPAITMLIPLLPFVMAALGAKRSMLVWLVIAAVMLVILYLVGQSGTTRLSEKPANFALIFVAVAAILSVMISLTAYMLMGRRAEYLTRLQEANAALEQARADATQADAVKQRFLGRMSHELRTPLNEIIGFAELLENDPAEPLPPPQRERLKNIQLSTLRLLELVNEVLEITGTAASGDRTSIEPVLPASVIQDAINSVRPLAASKEVGFMVNAPAHESTLALADRKYLLDVLEQVMSNAILFNRQGGTVLVSVRQVEKSIFIDITDSGVGIPPAQLATIFEPFSQNANEMRPEGSLAIGMGLGLALSKTLIEQMGGRITAASATNAGAANGSTFSIELPRYMHPISPAHPNAAA